MLRMTPALGWNNVPAIQSITQCGKGKVRPVYRYGTNRIYAILTRSYVGDAFAVPLKGGFLSLPKHYQ